MSWSDITVVLCLLQLVGFFAFVILLKSKHKKALEEQDKELLKQKNKNSALQKDIAETMYQLEQFKGKYYALEAKYTGAIEEINRYRETVLVKDYDMLRRRYIKLLDICKELQSRVREDILGKCITTLDVTPERRDSLTP